MVPHVPWQVVRCPFSVRLLVAKSPHTLKHRLDGLVLSPTYVKFLEDRDAPLYCSTFQQYRVPTGPGPQLFMSCNAYGKLPLPMTWKALTYPSTSKSSLLLLFPKCTQWKYLPLLPTSLFALGVLLIFLLIVSEILLYLCLHISST